jgi:type I restriction enzyme S subunit
MRDTWDKDTVGNLFYVKGRIGWRGLRRADFTEDGPYLITGMHIRDGQVNWDECFHIPERKFLESPEIIVQPGDMVVTKDGTIGKIAYIDSLPGPASLNSHLFLVRPKVNHIYARYAYHVLNSRLFMDFIEQQRTGSTLSGLPENLFVRFKMSYPDIDEQRAIVAILDTVDNLIRQTDALIVKLNGIKAGQLHDLLTRGLDENGNVRDPIACPEQFQATELGLIPRTWEVRKLGSLYALPSRNGLYKPQSAYGSGTLMIHMPQMFRDTIIDVTDSARVRLTEPELKRYELRPGDLVFARRSLNFDGAGQCGLISSLTEPVTFESSIIRVRLQEHLANPAFVNYFLNSRLGFKLRAPFVRQVAVSGVSSEDIGNLPILLPQDLHEQDRIVDILDDLASDIACENIFLDKLRRIKQGLMDDLLTGHMRAADVRLDLIMERE